MNPRKVLILGAAGRDFHNFNVFFRDDPDYRVVAFTATQIPDIAGRRYPAELAGRLYPHGIPILAEEDLEQVVGEEGVEEVVFSYSDVAHEAVMHLASRSVAAGAGFRLLGAGDTMLRSSVPVVSVCAVRTGAGKSQTTRRVASILTERGVRVVAVRHPMPYGDLVRQRVQRFATYEDLDRHECTIEEREEYEPHLSRGTIVYAGVDYGAILSEAEREAGVILWDGGNNDLPFFRSDLEIVVVDPHRPGHEVRYFPGEANLRRADVVVVNKVSTATREGLATVRKNVAEVNPRAVVIEADSPITLSDAGAVRGKRVLVIEDGPTLTHGEMTYGAGVVAAREHGATEIVDPRPHAVGSIAETFRRYPGTGPVLPAMGYGADQVRDLEATVRATPCDLVIIGTPIDLRRLIRFEKPTVRVTYDLAERGKPDLADVLEKVIERARSRDEGGTMIETLAGRDLISLLDFTREELVDLLDLAAEVKANPEHFSRALEGRTLFMYFEKPSLRTRVTFEAGMFQLGGHAINYGAAEGRIGVRESVEDVARNLDRWVEGAMCRTFNHQLVLDLASFAQIPVINGLTDLLHPCQALADFMTLAEVKGDLAGRRLVYVGDGNNVAHSLMEAGARLGVHVSIVTPEGYGPDPEIVNLCASAAAETGAHVLVGTDLHLVEGADAVYTDVWASMGQETEVEARAAAFAKYQVNTEVMRWAGPDAVFMHCLPAHRGSEVTDEVADSPQSVIFEQAENRLHAQKAVLLALMAQSAKPAAPLPGRDFSP